MFDKQYDWNSTVIIPNDDAQTLEKATHECYTRVFVSILQFSKSPLPLIYIFNFLICNLRDFKDEYFLAFYKYYKN